MSRRKNVIAPNDDKAIVAMEKMAVDIEKARELYGDGEPFDEERVLDCITFKADQSSKSLKDLAKYCLWLKAEVGHGRFMECLKRRNINYYAANWAMLIYEKFGSNFATWQNLGSHKLRALTYFSKDEIDKYAEGGPLGDILHDDVSEMTVRELEAEVRKLREKDKKTEIFINEKIRQKDAQIHKLEMENEKRQPPTKEQIAQAALQELNKDYTIALAEVNGSIRNALSLIAKAEKIENVNVQQLNDWMGQFDMEMNTFRGLSECWTDVLDNLGPQKDWRISDL